MRRIIFTATALLLFFSGGAAVAGTYPTCCIRSAPPAGPAPLPSYSVYLAQLAAIGVTRG